MNTSLLLSAPHPHIAHVQLNRPDQRNGLDLALFEALVATGEQLQRQADLRAVVLSGAGKCFCAGLDWKAFLALGPGAQRLLQRDDRSPANLAQRACWIWQELQVPVLAAVHGAALGGGLQLALAADLRYARGDAQLAAMEIRYGLIPDMSLSKTLPRLLGLDVAKELVFTGRTVSGEEAARLGLVTRLCEDPLAEALATARAIAERSPEAVRLAKRLLNQAPELPLPEALLLETELQLQLLGSDNQREAVMAVFEKRPPVFRDGDGSA